MEVTPQTNPQPLFLLSWADEWCVPLMVLEAHNLSGNLFSKSHVMGTVHTNPMPPEVFGGSALSHSILLTPQWGRGRGAPGWEQAVLLSPPTLITITGWLWQKISRNFL